MVGVVRLLPDPTMLTAASGLAVTALPVPSRSSWVADGMVIVLSSAVTRTTPQVPCRS